MKKTKISSFAMDPELAEGLAEAVKASGKSKSAYLRGIVRASLDFYDDGSGHPIATVDKINAYAGPNILTGIPDAGKTYFLRFEYIPTVEGPLLVIDPNHEYIEIENRLDYGGVFRLDFSNDKGKYRFETSLDVNVSKSEVEGIFSHLTREQGTLKKVKDEPRSQGWIIIIDEAHRFADLSILLNFVAESRKHVRKVIVVAQKSDLFKDLGKILRVARKREDTEDTKE